MRHLKSQKKVSKECFFLFYQDELSTKTGNTSPSTIFCDTKVKNILDQGKENDLMAKEWFTVKECLALPGYPTTAPSVRERLNQLAKDKPDLIRKRKGSKAWEYHISLFPLYVRPWLLNEPVYGRVEEEAGTLPLEDTWRFIFRQLTAEQKQRAISLFNSQGISALLPAVISNDDVEC